MKKKLDCCPKCKGTSGWIATERLILIGDWGEEHKDNSSDGINKYATCKDCGHRVLYEIAVGE